MSPTHDYQLSQLDLLEAEADLRTLEEAMSAGAHDDVTLRRYADAQARLEHAGGWGWRDHTVATIRGLGFVEDDLDRPLGTFSGGELTRGAGVPESARRRPRCRWRWSCTGRRWCR